MDGLRKSGTDRRSGVDRRNQLSTVYRGAERRADNERRRYTDRRDHLLLSRKTPKKKKNLLDLFFGRKGKDKETSDNAGHRSGPSHPVTFIDADVISPRAHERIICEVPVQILDRDTHSFYPATAHNYCEPGMYLESKHAPRIGSGVVIDIVNPSDKSNGPDNVARYYSKVVWRKKLSGNVVFLQYGMGVKHCRDLDEFLRLFSL